ncbi:MAG: hypothetical protein KAT79_05010, partial [candidate division Zixibacteria bacterium]|nr:hypothetical protein [candidate division Zixibacteria bacterium]
GSKLVEYFLRDWGYFATTTFWSKLSSWFGELGTKVRGAFSNFSYFRLLSTQRSLAYFVYTIVIIIFLGVAIGVPSWWSGKTNKVLTEFQEKASNLRSGGGK